MSTDDQSGHQKRHDGDLDIATALELSQRGLFDRVAFSAIFTLVAAAAVPIWCGALWLAGVLVYELAINPGWERAIARLPERRAVVSLALTSLLGAILYQSLALLCFASRSSIGVALGAIWVSGAVLNAFVYNSANRRLLLATLAPSVAVTLAGPALAYGLTWNAAIVPVLLGLSGVASRRFSVDHAAVVRQLADRQGALGDMERKLSLTIAASGDGLFELDLAEDRLTVSPNWLTMLGYDAQVEHTVVKSWRALVHPDDMPQLERDYRNHFKGETPHTRSEIRLRCKDESYKWVLSRASLVSRGEDGAPERVIGTTIDLTERKILEGQLEAARDAAEAANCAKGEFLANMSHEVRTPLTGILGFATLLEKLDDLSPSARTYATRISAGGKALLAVVNDILDFSKLEADRIELDPHPFDPQALIVETAELVSAEADRKGLSLEVEIRGALPASLYADSARVRQVLLNLLSNAIKFTHEGGVRVTAGYEQDAGAGRLRLAVTDTGVGIPQDALSRLFQRFSQVDGSITRKYGGTGLGLAISKRLTELMGGAIEVESREGEGSTFTVTLKAPVAQAFDRPAAAAKRVEEGLSWARILVVDDVAVNRELVRVMLSPLGCQVAEASGGADAVAAAMATPFDLILMDLQMPGMDGMAATRVIRQCCDANRHTAILALSANVLPAHRTASQEAGMNDHIAKPISPAELLSKVAFWASSSKVAGPAKLRRSA